MKTFFLEVTSKNGLHDRCGWKFLGKSRTKLFEKVWGDSGKNPSHFQKFASFCTYACECDCDYTRNVTIFCEMWNGSASWPAKAADPTQLSRENRVKREDMWVVPIIHIFTTVSTEKKLTSAFDKPYSRSKRKTLPRLELRVICRPATTNLQKWWLCLTCWKKYQYKVDVSFLTLFVDFRMTPDNFCFKRNVGAEMTLTCRSQSVAYA